MNRQDDTFWSATLHGNDVDTWSVRGLNFSSTTFGRDATQSGARSEPRRRTSRRHETVHVCLVTGMRVGRLVED